MTEGPNKLPSGWNWVMLGEVCQINPRRPQIDRTEEAATSFIPMNAVDERKGAIAELQTRPFSQVKRGYTYFEEGDVLFAKITPCMENGKAALASGLIDGLGFGSTEFHVLRPEQELVAKWMLFFVRQECFRQEAKKAFRGAVGQQRVPQEFLEACPIPLPPIAEQRRIVSRVEALMERVQEAKRLREQASGDIVPLLQSSLAEVLRELRSAYPSHAIGQLKLKGDLEIYGGGTPSKKSKAFWEGSIPWVSPKDMKRWLINGTEDHISPEAIEASSAKMIPAGAVLAVVRGMILARSWPIAIGGVDLTINQDMKALVPKRGYRLGRPVGQ